MKAEENKLTITDIIEIRLEQEIWEKILKIQQKYQISYSWVTRLCLVRLLKKQNPKHLAKAIRYRYIFKLKEGNPAENIKFHRHRLCLYGDDSIRLRVLAAKCGVSMSALVRLALDTYLSILTKPLSEDFLVNNGIKLVKSVVEYTNRFEKIYFQRKDYWPFRPFRGYFIL